MNRATATPLSGIVRAAGSSHVSFLHLLEQVLRAFDGTCSSAFLIIILAVCRLFCSKCKALFSSKQHQFEPFLGRPR